MTVSPSLVDAAALPPGFRGMRGQILVELKQAAGGLTARELAERCGVSLNAVRHHLKDLESESLLVRRREQRGVGAPVHLYFLDQAGENLFPRRYQELLTETLSRLEGPNGRPAIVEAMDHHYGDLARRLQADLGDATGQERLELVARILVEEGYMAAWHESAGAVRLTEHNCAIKAVAQRFPEICELEERFLRDVLGAGVERHSHILSGCQACEYSIHFPEPGPDGDPVPLGITRTAEKLP
jgi:DeoR family transcriptional regulator, suf operon transcriptional repressor